MKALEAVKALQEGLVLLGTTAIAATALVVASLIRPGWLALGGALLLLAVCLLVLIWLRAAHRWSARAVEEEMARLGQVRRSAQRRS